ncbi:MAG TPA: DUF368 domain-containing protein [Candidatus Dojkabacteria bacterium]|jgi:putative membrane protein
MNRIKKIIQNNYGTVLQGIVMGTAEIIPGVSGSTLALIMGIYDKFIDLLHSISDLVKEFIKLLIGKSTKKEFGQLIRTVDFRFGFSLIFGMGLAIVVLSKVLGFLFEEYPQYLLAFFFGLILASVYFPWKRMEKRGFREVAIIMISFLALFIILGLKPISNDNPNPLFVFIGGIVGISGMVLPGISGSFILLLIGLYNYIISAIENIASFNFNGKEILNLIIFSTGLATGFITFVRVLKILLTKFNSQLMAFLIGLMLASLRVLWPFLDTDSAEKVEEMRTISPFDLDAGGLILIILSLLFGLILVIGITFIQNKKALRRE